MNKILVVGDVMFDVHRRGNVNRLSPEAPVPIIDENGHSTTLGAAANVAAHVINAGIDCILAYKAYKDPFCQNSHEEFINMCADHNIICQPLDIGKTHPVTIKERIWANHQQVCRIDKEDTTKPNEGIAETWVTKLINCINNFNISTVIFSDYDKGTLTDLLIQRIVNYCHKKQIPTILDPKRPSFYTIQNLTIVKPNEPEMKSTNSDPEDMSSRLGATFLINTLAERGMKTYQYGKLIAECKALAEPGTVKDVCGCGDTVTALMGILLHFNAKIKDIVDISSKAAAISVRHEGCYVPSIDEMETLLSNIERNL
jgi:D-beta-D-heptose 7-phosphate kinase/D-beta-D-heptose 1-phosphate adenosyltransferase